MVTSNDTAIQRYAVLCRAYYLTREMEGLTWSFDAAKAVHRRRLSQATDRLWLDMERAFTGVLNANYGTIPAALHVVERDAREWSVKMTSVLVAEEHSVSQARGTE